MTTTTQEWGSHFTWPQRSLSSCHFQSRPARGAPPRRGRGAPAELAQELGEGQHGSFDYTTTCGGWERKELRMKDVIALLNDKRSELLDSVARIDAAIAARSPPLV